MAAAPTVATPCRRQRIVPPDIRASAADADERRSVMVAASTGEPLGPRFARGRTGGDVHQSTGCDGVLPGETPIPDTPGQLQRVGGSRGSPYDGGIDARRFGVVASGSLCRGASGETMTDEEDASTRASAPFDAIAADLANMKLV